MSTLGDCFLKVLGSSVLNGCLKFIKHSFFRTAYLPLPTSLEHNSCTGRCECEGTTCWKLVCSSTRRAWSYYAMPLRLVRLGLHIFLFQDSLGEAALKLTSSSDKQLNHRGQTKALLQGRLNPWANIPGALLVTKSPICQCQCCLLFSVN